MATLLICPERLTANIQWKMNMDKNGSLLSALTDFNKCAAGSEYSKS